jgi:hypothetical protein
VTDAKFSVIISRTIDTVPLECHRSFAIRLFPLHYSVALITVQLCMVRSTTVVILLESHFHTVIYYGSHMVSYVAHLMT